MVPVNLLPAIVCENLAKRYGAVEALRGLSFTVGRGEVFGLLGPNGAGKTTALEILMALRSPDSGSAQVLGCDPQRDPKTVKARIGVALQKTTLLPHLTPAELLALFAAFYPQPLEPTTLLTRFGLDEKRNARVQTLSGGEQQRLSLALALVGDPELIFLDEPTTGLDPMARRGLWDAILSLREAGRTIVLTTHAMDEAERLCDRLAILDRGTILDQGTPTELIARHAAGQSLEEVFLHLTGRSQGA